MDSFWLLIFDFFLALKVPLNRVREPFYFCPLIYSFRVTILNNIFLFLDMVFGLMSLELMLTKKSRPFSQDAVHFSDIQIILIYMECWFGNAP